LNIEQSTVARDVRRSGSRWLAATVVVSLLSLSLAVASCGSVGYYGRSIRGQMSLISKRRAIEKIVADGDTDAALRERLDLVLEIRCFASSDLGLPDNKSYRSYADLERPYAVWNVVATPELSVTPLQWCFPVAGCVSYRGYFSEVGAGKYAQKLRQEGHDVSVAGVSAYSTLGWFADPVLSTFVSWPEDQLAGLLFHELTHQRVYVKGETVFNESLATVVELEGLRRWLESRHKGEELAQRLSADRERQLRAEQFTDLVLGLRERLESLYASALTDEVKLRRKAELIAAAKTEYAHLRDASWNGYQGYDAWFDRDLNNAHLASVGTYRDLVLPLRARLEEANGDLSRFFDDMDLLAEMKPAERETILMGALD
jgi:predicted aminopeptidase